jgi:serine/threonine-protein kinase
MLIAQRYRLGASLGRGGMGEVFRASDELLGRQVAVKLMLQSGGQNGDAAAAERFQREARAAARLSDAHIVAVYDFGQYDGNFYLVMELVEGRSVAAEVDQDGPLPWDRAVEIVEQAAAGLAVAHAENVVHRDVKPSNLMVSADGVVKVADFGIAALPGAETSDLTMTGQILGSPYYLSPERARGQKGGPESDVYALGCVLYQLITGRPPFMGDHPTAVLYQHVDTDPVPPSRLRPELAGPFEGLLLRMLSKTPEDRPTAAQLTNVRAAADQLAAEALPTQPIAGLPPAALSAKPSAGPKSSKPLLITALAMLAVAGAITAGVVLNNHGDKLPSTVDVGPQPSTSSSTPTTPATTEPSSTGVTSQPIRRTTNTPSATPTATPSTTPTTSPTTPSSTPTTTPSTPTPTPTPTRTSSSPTPSATPTTTPPTTTSTPPASQTPPPSNTPTP